MSEQNRVTLTGALWMVSAVVLAALFISAAAQGELTEGHIALAIVILSLAIGGTAFVMRLKGDGQEKTKRRGIDNLLRDMSDEELIELKRRLADVGFDDETTVNSLGDDGEKLRRR